MLNEQDVVLQELERLAGENGLEVLEKSLLHSAGTIIVRVLADLPRGGITMDMCAKLNRLMVAYLEKTKYLGDDFSVEINSPGLDRKMRTIKDFSRVCGKDIMLWLNNKLKGKDYYEGNLQRAEGNRLILNVKGELLEIDMVLVITGKEKIVF